MSLPLLNLPQLARVEIFKVMDLHDIFFFSIISNRSKNIVKTCLKSTFDIKVFINKNLTIYRKDEEAIFDIMCPTEFWQRSKENWNIFGETVPTVLAKRSSRKLFPETPETFFRKLLVHLTDVFHIKSASHLEFEGDSWRNYIPKCIQILDSSNVLIQRVHIMHEQFDDFLIENGLETFCNVPNLKLQAKTTPEFVLSCEDREPFNFYWISIHYANWVTKDHLIKLFLNCQCLLFDNCPQYSNEDLTEFLKAWLAGSPLEYFHFCWKGQKLEEVVNGLEDVRPIRTAITLPIPFCTEGRAERFTDGRCYLLKQAGGVQGLIYYHSVRRIVFTTKFKLASEEEVAQEKARVQQKFRQWIDRQE